jgi:hypothetical protein
MRRRATPDFCLLQRDKLSTRSKSYDLMLFCGDPVVCERCPLSTLGLPAHHGPCHALGAGVTGFLRRSPDKCDWRQTSDVPLIFHFLAGLGRGKLNAHCAVVDRIHVALVLLSGRRLVMVRHAEDPKARTDQKHAGATRPLDNPDLAALMTPLVPAAVRMPSCARSMGCSRPLGAPGSLPSSAWSGRGIFRFTLCLQPIDLPWGRIEKFYS